MIFILGFLSGVMWLYHSATSQSCPLCKKEEITPKAMVDYRGICYISIQIFDVPENREWATPNFDIGRYCSFFCGKYCFVMLAISHSTTLQLRVHGHIIFYEYFVHKELQIIQIH